MLLCCASVSAGVAVTPFIPQSLKNAAKSIVARAVPSGGEDRGSHWRQMAEIFATSPAHPDVLMIGDSITAHGLWSEWMPGVSVGNRGISGDTMAGIRARLDGAELARTKVAVLMAGINDLRGGNDVGTTVEEFAGLLPTLTLADQAIVLSTLYTDDANLAEAVSQLNREMRRRCQLIENCKFIDLNETIAPTGKLDSQMSFDGLHLRAAGYAAWRGALTAYVDMPAEAKPATSD